MKKFKIRTRKDTERNEGERERGSEREQVKTQERTIDVYAHKCKPHRKHVFKNKRGLSTRSVVFKQTLTDVTNS